MSQKPPPRPHRIVRHDTDALPAAPRIKPLGFRARRIEHQQRPAARFRLRFGARHQRDANAAIARRAMHQQLPDVAAMRLVRRHVETELHGADNAAVELGCDQHGLAARDRGDHLLEERDAIGATKRQHEADACAAFDAVDEDVGEFIDRGLRGRGIENQDLGLCVHVSNMPVRAQRYTPGAWRLAKC